LHVTMVLCQPVGWGCCLQGFFGVKKS